MTDYMWNQPHNRDEFVDQFIAGKVLTDVLSGVCSRITIEQQSSYGSGWERREYL
jgi:hypothetical protein